MHRPHRPGRARTRRACPSIRVGRRRAARARRARGGGVGAAAMMRVVVAPPAAAALVLVVRRRPRRRRRRRRRRRPRRRTRRRWRTLRRRHGRHARARRLPTPDVGVVHEAAHPLRTLLRGGRADGEVDGWARDEEAAGAVDLDGDGLDLRHVAQRQHHRRLARHRLGVPKRAAVLVDGEVAPRPLAAVLLLVGVALEQLALERARRRRPRCVELVRVRAAALRSRDPRRRLQAGRHLQRRVVVIDMPLQGPRGRVLRRRRPVAIGGAISRGSIAVVAPRDGAPPREGATH